MRARYFAHVDMDAFYASVEILDRPELGGLPVAVGGRPGERGVIAAASYAARVFGVHSAMPTAQALRLCPELVLLPGRMSRYQELSSQILRILRDQCPAVEPLSLDEASLDLSGCARLHGVDESVDGGREGWTRFAEALQRRIHEETGLWSSVGLGETRRIAKIASDHRKPAGVVVVVRGEGRDFLSGLPVEKLRGVGPKMAERLRERGLCHARDISSAGRNQLQRWFGKAGSALIDMVEARDMGTVHPDRREKSVGHETTFARDLVGIEALAPVLSRLSEKVARRLHQRSLQGRVIQLKIRDRGFHTFTRRHSLSVPTDSAPTIRDQAMDLLEAMGWEDVPVRLIGVTVAGLTAAGVVQGELFATAEERRRPRIDRVVDEIQDRFGGHAFLRGRSLLATGIDRTPWGATTSRTGRPADSRTSPSKISERTPQ